MRSIKLLLIIAFGLFISCNRQIPSGYELTPTLLHLDRYKQHDSLGFNLATAVPEILYGKILSGDIALWSSPDKKVKIEVKTFLDMEKSAKAPFVASQDFFIHEIWRLYKRNFDFGIMGFSFTGEKKKGGKISYGYVDAEDIINLFKNTFIPCNANGSHYLTYWDALHSMQFHFNLVQFGNDNFKTNPQRSFLLKEQALKSNRVRRKLYTIEPVKEIEYRIISPNITSNQENKSAFKAIEIFINNNKQTILNAGGDKYFSHLSQNIWKVDQVVVIEKWSKKNDLPYQEFMGIRLFINKQPIDLSKKDIDEMNIRINLQGLEEYLSTKSFDFILQRINSEDIEAVKSEAYYERLLNNKWNHIKP